MLLPSFFTLILALQCVDAIVIFRLGNASNGVATIRDGTQPDPKDKTKTGPASDFDPPDAAGFTPSNPNKGLSVSTNIIPPTSARPVAQLIANANTLPEGPEKAKAIKAVNDALKKLLPLNVNPNGVWQADVTEATFPEFGLESAPNRDDSGHKLLSVITKTPKSTLQKTINDRFTKVDQKTLFASILALGGNPKANVAVPATGSGGSGSTSGAPPVNPIAPVRPAKPATPATPPTVPNPAIPPVAPKPPTVPRPPAAPRPQTGPTAPRPVTVPRPVTAPRPVAAPRPVTPPKVVPSKPTLNSDKGRRGTELLRMRRVRRTASSI
ncbi:hypothetical protein DL96DRAFT_210846 [Flagelloscypha sp. PMI_526]|nr:hypothetical protein DL96DRAFT_210846 [Flagelloscypha sp. PMI_526]